MRIGIATVQVPFVRGGAELLAENLQAAIRDAGHEAEIISLPFKWYPPARIPEHMLAARLMQVQESAGQVVDRLIGLKFPAYLMPHPSKRLWLLHQYRSAYDLWDQPLGDLAGAPDGAHVRSIIRDADAALLPECEALYTISRTVSDRLQQFGGITAEPLYHPPPQAERLSLIEYGDYVLFPSRINDSKRQHLAIEALALTRQPVRLCFLGASDAPRYKLGAARPLHRPRPGRAGDVARRRVGGREAGPVWPLPGRDVPAFGRGLWLRDPGGDALCKGGADHG